MTANGHHRVSELVISNFLAMSASTLEVPVQKEQLTIAAAEFAKARDSLNAHITIFVKEQSILLAKDNAQTTIQSRKNVRTQNTKAPTREKKIAAKPKATKERSKKQNIIQLSEAPSQSKCEEIITKFLATKTTETRAAMIQQFAAAGTSIANANTQTQTNNKCTVQTIQLRFSEDSKRSAVLAFIKARDSMKAQIKVRFSKQGVVLVKTEYSKKLLKEN
ncbi:MAG: hypothetical protein ABSF44_15985 [Candidatus Bathyarchaeia archaeon]